MSNQNESEFTPQEQHDIIMNTLSEFGKGSECFQLRWQKDSNEYLTGEILLQTPMFWFMKYKWSRQEIETLFYKAHVVITDAFDISLQQTFGGDPGARWKGGGGVKKKKKKQQQYIERDWNESDTVKNKQDHSMNYHINHPNFEYNPVDQPVHFEATGGVNNKHKNETNKQYDKPGWNRKNGNDIDENDPLPKGGGKLNDFLGDIFDEIKADDDKENENENEDEPIPNEDGSKLNDFLDDIYGEIKDEDENEDDIDEDEQIQLESFLNSKFSNEDLDDIAKETGSTSPTKNRKKHSKGKSSLTRTTTITTAKIQKSKSDNKLKRWSGGLNISNKANTMRMIQKSNTLRHEKAKLQAIHDAKQSQSETNVMKLKF